MSNIVGSFFKSVPSTASMSRSMVQIKVNCKTQMTGIVSAILLTMILLSISFVFEPLPKVSKNRSLSNYDLYTCKTKYQSIVI